MLISDIVQVLPNGKSRLKKVEAFCFLLNSAIPDESQSISSLFDEMDEIIQRYDANIKDTALSNAHGDWYEWLIAISGWNMFVGGDVGDVVLLLPNIAQFDVSTLYEERLQEMIIDLRRKLHDNAHVNLITSNPDFVIIDGSLARRVLQDRELISSITPSSISYLENIYSNFVGQCRFDDIRGYVSVKKSVRPDRRLQIPHEGSLMKAIYAHLQTRMWMINPKGIKYYAISALIGEADRVALRTVATHSITTVSSMPQLAVDNVFVVDTLINARDVLQNILPI